MKKIFANIIKTVRNMDTYLIIILLIYLVLQMAVIFMYGENYYLGDFTKMDNDDVKYVRSGLKLIDDFKLYYQTSDFEQDVSSVFIMPGYPLFLAVFLKIFSCFGLAGGLLAVRLVQGVLQLGVICLLFRIGKKYFSVWAARVAIILYVLYIPNLQMPLLVLTEVVFTFLFVLLMSLCLEAVETRLLKYYVGGAVILGMATMVRPTALLFPVVILVMWLLKKYSPREMVRYTLVVGGILVAILAPWWIRNAVEFHRFIPLTLSSGNPFMQGAFIDYDFDETESYYPDYTPPPDDASRDTSAIILDRVEMDGGMKRLQESWKENPLATIEWYTVGKYVRFWNYPYYNHLSELDTESNLQRTFPVPFETMTRWHRLLLALACLGFVLNGLRGEPNRRLKLLLPLSVIYMSVIYLPFFTFSRYAYPLMPIMLLLAACGICSSVHWLRWGLKHTRNLISRNPNKKQVDFSLARH